jgi:CRISPR/Cas system CMR subunit Cmr6 (Cas7 group RAMP superfamily)
MQIEESAGEIHFQDAMPVTEEAVAFEVLQTLYADDKDHASRIKAYVTRRIPYSRL